MRPDDVVELADVVYVMDLRRVGVDAALHVAHDRVLLPTALQQLVEHGDVLLGAPVAVLVHREVAVAEIAGRVLQVGGDDVPRHPTAREMVQGGHPAREVERVLLQHRVGEGEPEVLCGVCHRGDQQRGIVERDLQPLLHGGVAACAIAVVGADHVGEEQGVELAALEQLRKLHPWIQARVLDLARVRPHPLTVVDVGDAVHRECVEAKATV